MLAFIQIKNLKSFRDTGHVRLRPITFLMGQNSSGKSTILQSLLVARQTVDSRDVQNPVVIDGSYTQLGSYQELIHRHDKSLSLHLNFGFVADIETSILAPSPNIRGLVYKSEFSYNQRTLQIYPVNVIGETFEPEFKLQKRRINRNRSELTATSQGGKSASTRISSVGKFYDFGNQSLYGKRSSMQSRTHSPDDPQSLLYSFGYSLPFLFETGFQRAFQKVFYLGPLRNRPERSYVASGETPQDVGLRGESTFDILWSASRDRDLKKSVFAATNHWLSRIGISANLEIRRMGGPFFSLIVTDPVTSVEANFADIGFGGSQLLPAIVEALHSPEHATLILEQPEIHLHPTAQSNLGDLFIDLAKTGRQFIIETHSEHIVTRVLRRIAEGEIDPSWVSILFCQKTPEGSSVRDISIDTFGQFEDDLPTGFFDQAFIESMEHARAMSVRSQNNSHE